jgi:hypothetical protein
MFWHDNAQFLEAEIVPVHTDTNLLHAEALPPERIFEKLSLYLASAQAFNNIVFRHDSFSCSNTFSAIAQWTF